MTMHTLNFVGGQELALASSRLGETFTLLKQGKSLWSKEGNAVIEVV